MHELLYGMMLRSGNDAAVALALADSGSISAFAMRMNEKAAVLGLKNTHYANPHGLDSEENYSTALDLARLTRFALQNPDFAQLVSTKSVTIADRVLTNHNKLLWQYSGAIGVKTGFTDNARRCLVSAAQRDGVTLIAVTLNAGDDWNDHTKMLDYGFTQVRAYPLETSCADRVAVAGTGQSVGVRAQPQTLALTPEQRSRIIREVCLPAFVYGSVSRGDQLGEIKFLLDGRVVCACPLLADSSVEVVEEGPGLFRSLLSKLGIYV